MHSYDKSKVTIHPQAIVEEGVAIGNGTRIWAFAHILPGAVIGSECNICDHTFIEGSTYVGSKVTIKSGVYLWDGVKIEDDVFIGPNVTFTNDLFPRSKQYPEKYLETHLRRGCSIGANATILPTVSIGEWAMVGAGTVVTRDVPAFALVYGSPGCQHGWVGKCGHKLNFVDNVALCCDGKYLLETESHVVVCGA
jgi:acetyltransferase-like isoleucine patch superfamily enzyme